MNNALYYNPSGWQNAPDYSSVQGPFKTGDRVTQLPKNTVMIRTVAVLAYTSIVAFALRRAPIFCWPVVVAGVAFAGWTIYSHLFSKDPLMEAFYKICGGKDKFAQLPEISLQQNSNEKISQAIARLNWSELNQSIGKAKTLDGRHVIVVKALGRNNSQTQGVFAFIERLGPDDVPRSISNLSELGHSILDAIVVHHGNRCGTCLTTSYSNFAGKESSSICSVNSSISQDMANDFFAQLNPA